MSLHPRPRISPLPGLFRRPRLSRLAALTSAALVTALAATLAAPAQAWAPPVLGDSSLPGGLLVPADSPATVQFHRPADGAATFPAGTYWIGAEASTPRFEAWVEDLSARFERPESSLTAVTLTESGPLSHTLATSGEVGRVHVLSVYPVADGLGDPADLSDEEVRAALQQAISRNGTADVIRVTATRVSAPMPVTDLGPLPIEADVRYPMRTDVTGLGADLPVHRLGAVFHVPGLDGARMSVSFGRASDEWFTGDWDGDGKDSVGLRRGNTIFLDNDFSGGVADVTFTFGRSGDELRVGDWDGDGTDTVALRRGNVFHVTNAHAGGTAPIAFTFGRADDSVAVGDWDGDGKDTVGLYRDDFLYVRNSLTTGTADGVHRVGG